MKSEELIIEVAGSYKEPEGSDEFTKFMKRISKETGKFELVGVGVGSCYGIPVFEIDKEVYLLKDDEYQEDKLVLTLGKPENFLWETLDQFMCSEV